MEPTMRKPRLKMAMAAAEMLYSAKQGELQNHSLSGHFLPSKVSQQGSTPWIPISHLTEAHSLAYSLTVWCWGIVRTDAKGLDSRVSFQGAKLRGSRR